MREGYTGAPPDWRGEITIFCVTLLLMLWPLAVNHAPFYSADSASYLRGGGFGFSTALLILGHWWQSIFGSIAGASASADPAAIVAGAIADSGGARSLIYSILTFLLRGPGHSLIALAVVQAGLVVLALSLLRKLLAPDASFWPSLGLGAGVALTTSAPWYAAYAVPDIFAGIAIAAAVALTIFSGRAGLIMRLALVLLIALSITVHGSHLPIVFGTLAAGGAVSLWLDRGSIAAGLRKMLWLGSPVVLAVAVMLGSSYAAFGEASLAPKRYPIQLARSVADGPGAWHLRDHCATERYAICEVFGPTPPRSVGQFLWGKDGVRYRATPEQMERIRAEESMIVRRAAMEYPGHQVDRSVRNIGAQLLEFGFRELVFGYEMTGGEDPSVVQQRSDMPSLRSAGEGIIYASFLASLLLVAGLWRRMQSMEKAAVAVAAAGLLVNAAVCAGLSGVADRYQGRVAWVLPALALMILVRVWTERRRPGERPEAVA